MKHTNPCGIAVRGDLLEAYRLAVRADPISAFGGIVAFNRTVDAGGLPVLMEQGLFHSRGGGGVRVGRVRWGAMVLNAGVHAST